MPLGKYYCDYCDKQFQDTIFARKRHLRGLQHLRAKALWYDSFKDPSHEGLPRGICNRFVNTGFCQYGDSCKYFHPKNHNGQAISSFSDPNQPPNFQGNQLVQQNSFFQGNNRIGDKVGVSTGNLPPSLQPPPDGGYPALPFLDWG